MATAIGDLVVRLNAQSAPFERAMSRAQGTLGRFTTFMRSSAGQFATFAASLTGIGAAFMALKKGVQLAADMEMARISFEVLLGSASDAHKVLADLVEFAEKTPFELPEVTQATRQLAAFGVATDQLLPTLRRIGDVSSAINQPLSEIADIYGRNRIQGRLFAKDIREFTGRGIPIVQALAQNFGVSNEKIMQMVTDGKIGFKEMEEAFVTLTEKGGRFGGMMERQSQTIGGRWSTLRDTFNGVLRDIGFLLIETFNFKAIIENLIAFGETCKSIVEGLGVFFRNFGAVVEIAFIDILQAGLDIFPQLEAPIMTLGSIFIGVWEGVGAFFATWLESIKGGFLELKQFTIAIGDGIAAAFAALKAGEFSSIGSAFADAFINTLANQQNVEAKNAFAEFGRAFNEGQQRILDNVLKKGGVSKALDDRKQELLKGIGEAEFKRFEAMTPKDAPGAAVTAMAEETESTKGDIFAGAMERGSADAWSTILAAWRGSQDKVSKGEKEIVREVRGVRDAVKAREEPVIEIPS